jgi:hypothetical protein
MQQINSSKHDELFDAETDMIEEESKLKKEFQFQSIPPSIRPANSLFEFLKEGENLVKNLPDVFPNYYKKWFVPVRKREDNDFFYFKYVTNESKKKQLQKKLNKKTRRTIIRSKSFRRTS